MRIAPIKREDTASVLDCGESDINSLIRSAYPATIQRQGIAFNAFIEDELVAQVMLTMITVADEARNSFPKDREFAGVKIEYIAVSKEWQDQGIGTALMDRTVKRIKTNAALLPIRFIMLESVPNKESWYHRLGFRKLAPEIKWKNRDETTVPMYMDFMDEQLVKDYEEWYASN